MADTLNNGTLVRVYATIVNDIVFGLYERRNPDTPYVILVDGQIIMAVDYLGNANRLYNQTIRHYAYQNIR